MLEQSIPTTIFEVTRQLLQKTAGRSEAEKELIMKAMFAAAEFHGTQLRKSGEPFMIHPLQVTFILVSTGADTPTLAAALLHDTVEDTDATLDDIEQRFGPEITQLVEAVTRQPMFSMKEFFEKILAKAKRDPRVACMKIADQCANHMNGSQMIFSAKAHAEHLNEMEHFYLSQLVTVPEIPKELIKLLERIHADSKNHYTKR